MAEFEGKERRMPKIEVCLAENGIASLEEAREICKNAGVDVEALVKGVQPIAFENAVWAYTLGAAIGIKRGVKSAADAARCLAAGARQMAYGRGTAPLPLHPAQRRVANARCRCRHTSGRLASSSLRAGRCSYFSAQCPGRAPLARRVERLGAGRRQLQGRALPRPHVHLIAAGCPCL